VIDYVTGKTRKKVEFVSHGGFLEHAHEARFSHAEAMLELYARASCVVTNRLHSALPCVAMGTPVLLLDTAPDTYRFAGLSDFVRHDTVDAFVAGRVPFDLEQPPPNLDLHLPVRQALSARVTEFVQAAMLGREPPTYPLDLSARHQVLSLNVSRVTAALLLKQQRLEKLIKEQQETTETLPHGSPGAQFA
jgi:hypothetical protein